MRGLLIGAISFVVLGGASASQQDGQQAGGQDPGEWRPPPDSDAQINSLLAPPADGEPSDEGSLESRSGFDALVAQLGSPSYKEREAATLRLVEAGPAAFAALKTAYPRNEELEVRLRIEKIVREAFLDRFVYGQNAFLGISQVPVPILHDDDERIQEGHVGIQVQRVIKDTAAEQAELMPKDVIIALDGELIEATGRRATAAFGESIRVRRPGARLTLTILRGSRQFDREVTLGKRPKAYYGANQGKVFQMLEYYREQFDLFWAKHFNPQGLTGDPGSPVTGKGHRSEQTGTPRR